MEKFYFEAANQDGKKVSGVIEASNIEQARSALKERKFAVFALEKFDASKHSETNENQKEFEFSGKNKEGQKVSGNITAVDIFQAYKTLKIDYKYAVKYLFDTSISEEEKSKNKKNGIEEYVLEWFEIEKIKDKKRKEKEKRKTKTETKSLELSDEEKRSIEFFQAEVSRIVDNSFLLLKQNSEFLDKSKKREIEDRLNLLSRLRRSTAIEHLKTLTEKVLKELEKDTIFLENLSKEDLIEKQEEFKLFSSENNGQLSKMTLAIPIDIDLEEFDIDVLKVKFKQLRIFSSVTRFIYELFFVGGLIGLMFFAFSFIMSAFSSNETWHFYSFSKNLWQLFYINLLVIIVFSPLYFAKSIKTPKRILYLLCGTLFFVFAFLQFESIFFWTII